jgi:hypothetical protein
LPEQFVFRAVLSWPNTGILIEESVESCARIVALFVLTPETSDRIGVTCGRRRVSVTEIFLNSEKTGTKELHEQNCAPTAEISEATRVISGKTVAICDLIVVIVARMCATSTVIGIEPVMTKSPAVAKGQAIPACPSS